MINLGLRAHDFEITDNLEALAEKISASNIHYIQFANGISLPTLTNNGQQINPGLGLQVRRTLAQYDIEIGVLSCYINLIHPDQKIEQQNLKQFKRYLTNVANYGATLVATEPGSVDPAFNFTTDNYTPTVLNHTLANIKELVNTAEKVGQFVGIEAGINHPIHSLETIAQMFEQVNSPNLKLILDPVNLLHTENKNDLYSILQTGLQQFGDRIQAIHAKDYTFQKTKEIVTPGTGEMDFNRFFSIVEQQLPGTLVILDEAPRIGLETGLSQLNQLIN